MCPALAKTSDQEVVAAARAIVEQTGAAALSMQAVAQAVGVRPPSLYKRFADRDRLLDEVARGAMDELATKLQSARDRAPAGAELVAMARAYRSFAKRAPRLYALIFSVRDGSAELHDARAQSVAPLFEVLRATLAEADVLPAARMLTAFLHGFVAMETSGAFQLGGDVQKAFDFSLERLVRSLGDS
jgi:AcrR family transcriptional regulator